MAGYLAVTDNLTLTPLGAAAVAKDFLLRSEYNPEPFPSYAGAGTKAHRWSAPFYNTAAPSVSKIRGGIIDALYAGADYHLVMVGDSKTEGSGVNGGDSFTYAYPATFRRILGAVEGILPAYNGGNVWDKRWTGYGFKKSDPDYSRMGIIPDPNATLPYWIQFASDFAHTGGTFWVHADVAATLTVTVDGGAGQTIAVAAGNGFQAVTPTVTGDTAHTYRIDTPDKVHITTFVPTYSGPRLKVSRLGRGGSTAEQWKPGYNADGTGLWDSMSKITANAATVGLGTNGAQLQADADALIAVYAAMVGLGIPVIGIAPGGLGGTGAARPISDYSLMYAATWSAADTYNLPIIDFQSIVGDWPTANTAGLMADNLHENRKGYAYEAAALRSLLA